MKREVDWEGAWKILEKKLDKSIEYYKGCITATYEAPLEEFKRDMDEILKQCTKQEG